MTVLNGTAGTGTVDFLLRRMQHTEEFPVLSESIRSLNQITASEDQDMCQLGRVLIRDFALTNKILRVVNSAFYSRFSGKIGTITRALVVLGINTIRTIATSLILFEQLHNNTRVDRLKDLIGSAIFSATLARQLAEESDQVDAEEGFLCGMLHNLGQVLVEYYLHRESDEIQRLVLQEGVAPEQAQRRVLGMDYHQFGIAVSRLWSFPDVILRGMQKTDPARPGDLRRSDIKLRLIANFANEASVILGEGGDPQAFQALIKRYRSGLAISDKRFSKMLQRAREEFLELSSLSSGHKSPFMRQVTAFTNDLQEQQEQGGHPPVDQSPALNVIDSGLYVQEVEDSNGITATPERILTEGLEEVSSMLLDEQINLNQIFSVVLESIYRAFSFQRVLLCLKDAGGNRYAGRLGFGREIDRFVEQFHFPRAYSADVFHAALKNGVDLYISDTADQRIQDDLPSWFHSLSNARAFAIFPLIVGQQPVGLIYAEQQSSKPIPLDGKPLNLVKALRNQVLLALKNYRPL